MFQRSGLTWVVVALALWITPALSQGLNRRADLVLLRAVALVPAIW
jgi:hypothetical protein